MGVAAAVACLVALAGARATSASPEQSVGSLRVGIEIPTTYKFGDAYCPSGVAPFSGCVRFVGTAQIPGLGRVTTTYVKVLPSDDPGCPVLQFNVAMLEIEGKGTLELSRPGRSCGPTAPAVTGPFVHSVTGGSGAFAGATGTLTLNSSVAAMIPSCQCGAGTDTWSGELVVAGMQFDVTSPTLTGATSRTIRVARRTKGTRVRYAVAASDAVDGAVDVACDPRSGSFFSLGRTRVACETVDSSGNTATASFVVTVKRR